jgi:hypothetical protein
MIVDNAMINGPIIVFEIQRHSAQVSEKWTKQLFSNNHNKTIRRNDELNLGSFFFMHSILLETFSPFWVLPTWFSFKKVTELAGQRRISNRNFKCRTSIFNTTLYRYVSSIDIRHPYFDGVPNAIFDQFDTRLHSCC